MTLVFMLFAVLLVFVGCGETPSDTTLTGTEKSGEFVVSGEKYTYKNKDVLLLNVENQTEKNYDVTAVVHYFDAEGNEIKSQKQTFDGWASGYQNYFLFQPSIIFETFTYDLELEEIEEEECYSKYIAATFAGLKEKKAYVTELIQQDDYTKWSIINADFKWENKSINSLNISVTYIVIDANKNIYHISKKTLAIPSMESYKSIDLYYDLSSEKLVWPEELKGEVCGLCAITKIWR